MDNETDKLIKEQLQKLPPNLQQAIKAVSWQNFVQEVARNNGLNTEQSSSLEQETMLVLYTFDSPNNFVGNITREVGVDSNVANAIAEEIAEKVFLPIQSKSEGVSSNIPQPISTPTTPTQDIHPMIEKGEVAHEVPHKGPTTNNPLPTTNEARPANTTEPLKAKVPKPSKNQYPGGKDPYREPPE